MAISEMNQTNNSRLVRYGDGAGNTAEEKSSVFSLIRMRYLQCFDTVGWVAGRASGP